MNNTTQSRYGTTWNLTFPDFPSFSMQPQWFRLHQEQGKQDVIELAFGSFNPIFYSSLKTGVPFRLVWKTATSSNEFVGYVYNVSQTTQASIKRNVIVQGVGAGFSLKEGGNKIWTNKTASEIVMDIAKQFKLKPIVTQSPVRFAQQSMVGHTYWEKIQELAARQGYVSQISGTELHFHPIDKMIDNFSTSIPVLSFTESQANVNASYESQTLDMFKPIIGDLHEGTLNTKKDKTVSGIDPVTGKIFSNTSSPNKVGTTVRSTSAGSLFKQIIPTRMADTPAVAKAMSDAFAQLGRFSNTAEGAGQGDPRIAPYRTIEINGTGTTTDGYWIVTSVTHFVTYDGRYSIEFTCMTDGVGKNKVTVSRPSVAGVVPTRNIQAEMSTGAKVKPAPANLSAKQAMIKQTNTGFKVTPRRWTA